MQSGPKEKMARSVFRVESTRPQDDVVCIDQMPQVSHFDTNGLGSVWHTAAGIGSWSITEALAAICTGLFAATHDASASVQLVVPSSAQALLTTSLFEDLDIVNMSVSTATMRPRGSRPNFFVVSLPQIEDAARPEYVEMVWELLKHDVRPDVDDVISVGEEPLLHAHSATQLVSGDRQSPPTACPGRFADRGDLVQRLLHLSPTAQEQMLPSYLTHDVNSMPVLMGHSDWSDEEVVCLCGPNQPPIMTRFTSALSEKADVLTNRPELFGDRVTTLEGLRNMRDFADEALMCTWAGWLLVEPQVGRGGKPHRDATLFMRAASTTCLITKLALGRLDGAAATHVLRPDEVTHRETTTDWPVQPNATPVEVVSTPVSTQVTCQASPDGKKHRCRRYGDIYDRKLRAVMERMTDEEIRELFASLEEPEAQ